MRLSSFKLVYLHDGKRSAKQKSTAIAVLMTEVSTHLPSVNLERDDRHIFTFPLSER